MKELTVKLTLIISSAFLFSLVLDRSLALFDYPTESPGRYSHPSNFHEIRKNIEYTYKFDTNHEGLRYEEVPLEKPEGSYRVLVIGDSFTEGLGVNVDERFTALLEKSFKRQGQQISFINGGLSGTDPRKYGQLPFQLGERYKLDGLLIAIYINDSESMPKSVDTESLIRDYIPKRSGIKWFVHLLWPRTFIILRDIQDEYIYRHKTTTTDFVGVVSKKALDKGIPQVKIDEWKAKLPKDLVAAINRNEFYGYELSFGLLSPDTLIDAIDVESDVAKMKWHSMASVLSAIVNRSREAGLEVGVIFIPDKVQYDPLSQTNENPIVQTGTHVEKEWLSGQSGIEKDLRIWAREEHVPLLDLTPVFQETIKTNPQLTFKLDLHWNATGHYVASKAIEEWLRSGTVFSFIPATHIFHNVGNHPSTTLFKATSPIHPY